ncbi:hypothetical protein CYMTET_18896 [Cymbomonas tetramitiformis]|uniref:Uncharacterized protein n=1 Tax=Cymbomonas tetramitiformis TaxID=36881 RepID=A0AAE0G7A3_9CHLO|nr:hypothetical protein CYMTET_18896 [Cymbomonas tetramitiformis]
MGPTQESGPVDTVLIADVPSQIERTRSPCVGAAAECHPVLGAPAEEHEPQAQPTEAMQREAEEQKDRGRGASSETLPGANAFES